MNLLSFSILLFSQLIVAFLLGYSVAMITIIKWAKKVNEEIETLSEAAYKKNAVDMSIYAKGKKSIILQLLEVTKPPFYK